jgi:hypothetical protein
MNVACKLGEDLAQQSEILLTATAYTALQDSAWQFEQANFSISGLELTAYRLIQDHETTDVSRSDADPSALPAQG